MGNDEQMCKKMGNCAQYHKKDVYLQHQTINYETNDITNTKSFDLR
jgi:hypothetical protein